MIEAKEIKGIVVSATNILLEAKKINPGSDDHAKALEKLTRLLAEKPGAIDVLSNLQKEG